MEEVSELSVQRLMAQRGEVLEEHVLTLAKLREELMDADGEAPGQCGTTGAAAMAEAAGVKKLILVHMGAHIAQHGPLEKGLGDIREVYGGQVIYAEELMAIDV